MANWAGAWALGAGYTLEITQPAYVFTDPKFIETTGGVGVFTKLLMTLGGSTQLFGKRNEFPSVRVAIAEDSAVPNLCADPPVAGSMKLIPASGTTKTCSARVVKDMEFERIGPDQELCRIVTIQGSSVWA